MRNQIRYIAAAVVVVAGIAIIVATQGSAKKPSATPTTTTTTKSSTGPIAPLTGLPDPSGSALKRPALVIKVEDDTNSLPQWGVDQADVVYEEIINGGIPRLAAIFNQNAPTLVGPIRSVRPTDTQIVDPIGGIFAFSGGAPYAIASISTAPVKQIQESNAGSAMFRDNSRQAPYNLFGSAAALFALGAGSKPVPPVPLFQYRPLGQGAVGTPVSKFVVNFPSIYPMTWTWDTTTHSWDRSTQFAGPDYTGNHVRESPKNVIVTYVNYVNGVGAFTSYANLQSGGVADVFTDGKEIVGTWARHSPTTPIEYLNAKGKAIRLTPGQTWVELLNNGAPVTVTH